MTDFDKKARELADVGYAMRFALIAAALKAAYNEGFRDGSTRTHFTPIEPT